MSLALDQMHGVQARPADDFAGMRRRRALLAMGAGLVLCLGLALVAMGQGAVPISPGRVARILLGQVVGGADMLAGRDALVVLNIRLPRVLLGLMIGAALAVSGAVMQGLFRNPLADPGLVGVSAGAGLAAAVTIVLGDRILAGTGVALPFAALPAGAFCGGLMSTIMLYLIATRQGRTSIATMLLAGIALGALAGAFTGLLSYLSDDRQLRDLAFWSLGASAEPAGASSP